LTYLLAEIWAYLLVAAVLGLLAGWVLGRRRTPKVADSLPGALDDELASSVRLNHQMSVRLNQQMKEELAEVKAFWGSMQESWDTERRSLQEEVRKRTAEIDALHFDLGRLRARAREWDGLSEAHEHTLRELRTLVARKDHELSLLRASIGALRTELQDCGRRADEREATLSLLESKLQASPDGIEGGESTSLRSPQQSRAR
jgi:chromosome segregation ATPase